MNLSDVVLDVYHRFVALLKRTFGFDHVVVEVRMSTLYVLYQPAHYVAANFS